MPNKINPKRDLPYIAAASQVVQFVNAGYTLMGWRGAVCGLFLGALVSMTVAYAASQFTDIAKVRKPVAGVLMVALLSFSPIIVGAAAFLDLPAALDDTWTVIVAAAWGILPDFSVALDGFIAGRGLVAKDETDKPAPIRAEKPQPAQTWKDKPYRCDACGVGYDKQTSLAAHYGHSKSHKPQPTP